MSEPGEVGPNNNSAFSAYLSDRSVCESSNQPTRGLHQLETRPRSHPHRRLHDKLGSSTGLCLPPFNLISPTQTKATIDQTELILVAPVWQAQPWWPVLLRLLISQQVLLPNSPTLSTDPSDMNRVHPMYPRLHLAVIHISTNASKLRAFQQTLDSSQQLILVPPHTIPTSLVEPLVPLVFWTANWSSFVIYKWHSNFLDRGL